MKFLNEWALSDFTRILQKLNYVDSAGSVVYARPAGEGNMNYTYRLGLNDGRTLITKQSPPYCAKYPQIPAPEERIFAEREYYDLVASEPELSVYTPKILGFERSVHLLLLEDLGAASDLDTIYGEQNLTLEQNKALARYLSALHRIPKGGRSFSNHSMRKLNHDYIFTLPFDKKINAIDLNEITAGLAEVAAKVKSDPKLKALTEKLGQVYLRDELELVHGDFYPRSWVETSRGLFVIDPEFGHFGRKEFDLGVFLAHLMVSGGLAAGIKSLESYYASFDEVDFELLTRFAAVEVLRRLLFVAQVPVKNELSFKTKLIELSHQALLSGSFKDLQLASDF